MTNTTDKIKYVTGNALEPIGKRQKLIVHVCNSDGVMGAGIAYAIAKKWPEVYDKYRAMKKRPLGIIQTVMVNPDVMVCNMIAQHLRPSGPDNIPLVYKALDDCLKRVALIALLLGWEVHMPRIGAGLAGGDWERIEQMIEHRLCGQRVSVIVYDLPIKKQKRAGTVR